MAEQQSLTVRAASLLLSKGRSNGSQKGSLEDRLQALLKKAQEVGYEDAVETPHNDLVEAPEPPPALLERPSEPLQEKPRPTKATKKVAPPADEDCMYCKLVCGNLPDPEFCKENFKKLDRKEITQEELEALMASKFGPRWEDDVFKALEKKGFKVVG